MYAADDVCVVSVPLPPRTNPPRNCLLNDDRGSGVLVSRMELEVIYFFISSYYKCVNITKIMFLKLQY